MTETTPAQGTRYTIDARGSRFTISAYASGLLSAVGHDPVVAVRDIQGEVRLAPDNARRTGLVIKMAAKSLAIQNDVNDKDRREIERAMYEDVLDVSRFPEIVYEASGARIENVSDGRFRVELDGQLTLHGATRKQRVTSQVFLMGDTLRGQGDFTLRQTDYGIKPCLRRRWHAEGQRRAEVLVRPSGAKGALTSCVWPFPDRSSNWSPAPQPAPSSRWSAFADASTWACCRMTCPFQETGC